nr:vacuolar protein sorting-associated protein 9A-like isoform X2 [Lolium perenne]
MESPSSAASRVDFYGFLDRMRRPAAAGLFRSIKSFLASLSLDAEEDGARVQAFYAAMEAAFREHPLWANATHQEIDHALEGLEKYVMTKLFDRTFAASPEDAAADAEVSERIGLLQRFVRPQHLDIPKVLHNEASWLVTPLAVKELQKINSFKSPRDKLLCVMSCCQVINNLLLNVSMSNDRTPSGADEFLPILIYITIKTLVPRSTRRRRRSTSKKKKTTLTSIPTKANPPHLHSNLKFVELFRRETKLVSEVEYYLTNLISAKMFILNVDGRSLSMEQNEFQMHMETAKLGTQICAASLSSPQGSATSTRGLQKQTDTEV